MIFDSRLVEAFVLDSKKYFLFLAIQSIIMHDVPLPWSMRVN